MKHIYFLVAWMSVVFFMVPVLAPDYFPNSDHGHHILKFELMARHGLTDYSELGGISYKLLIPPALLLMYPLVKLMGPRMAYFFMTASLPALALLSARKLEFDVEPVFVATLFPVSLLGFFFFGRILELLANLCFMTLFTYLYHSENPSLGWSTVLFIFGFTSHVPAAFLYFFPLLILAQEKGLFKHAIAWITSALAWAALYLPKVVHATGMLFSRLEFARYVILPDLQKSIPFLYSISAVLILLLTSSLFFLKRERKYFFVPLTLGLVSFSTILVGPTPIDSIPPLNQLAPVTYFVIFSYLLWRNFRKRSYWFSLALIPLALGSITLWTAAPNLELHEFDHLEGNYTMVTGCSSDGCMIDPLRRDLVNKYLVHRGLPSPFCSTWEYSDPDWFFYNPANCKDLEVGLNNVILDAQFYPWAANCTGSRLVEGFFVVSQ